MKHLTSPPWRLAPTLGFLPTKALGLLILLLVGNVLQAQSVPAGTSAGRIDSNSVQSTLAAIEAEGADAKHPAPILYLSPPATFTDLCASTTRCSELFATFPHSHSRARLSEAETSADEPDEGSKPSSSISVRASRSTDYHQSTYYKNKLEFSLDGGWLPINIPFVFDVFLGDAYHTTSLKYTLVPVIGSIRWQIDDVGGPWIFRGNLDLECSGALTFIPRGPETRYIAWILGVRRNFVPQRGKIAPYFDGRVGLGGIDAKGPSGVLYAQGQDFTFTMNMGSGVRYNFNPRYSISAGLNWMHISNLYLSEPKFSNYGINVYGPMFGIDVRLGRPHRHTSE